MLLVVPNPNGARFIEKFATTRTRIVENEHEQEATSAQTTLSVWIAAQRDPDLVHVVNR
jgi:hypothetical protein